MIKEKLKYFIINKPRDFERGLYDKLHLYDDGLEFSFDGGSGVGSFVSRIFDSGDRGTEWHRLTLETENCARSDLRITVYASDSSGLTIDGSERELESIFADETFSLREKLRLFEPFRKKKVSNASDVLLHDVNGCYVWFLIEIYSRSDLPARISELKVYLPSQSWIYSLPQIYRKSDADTHFLERYLAVFQTVFEELEAEIANSAYNFDPECADYDFLLWLADWLDISESWLWEEEKLRLFIIKAISLYRMRGTKESLEGIIELYTGEKPFIIEESSLSRFAGTEFYDKTLLKLYGNDPYTITVLIKRDKVKSDRDYTAIKKVAAEMLPASFTLHIVLLEPYIFAGQFSYLGVNSTLGNYKPAAFDGRSTLMLSTLEGGQSDLPSSDNNNSI